VCSRTLARDYVVSVAAGVVAVTLTTASVASRPADAAPEILARVGIYVQQLEARLAVLIGDEVYQQDVWGRSSARGSHKASRTMRSEIMFMWLAQEQVWLSIRNILTVDGRFIPDSKARLDHVLAMPTFDAMTRLFQIKAESARYDLGQVWRTTGDPSLVLRFLLPASQDRFAFSVKGDERLAGEHVVKIAFVERDAPTAIDFNGRDVLSKGEIWVRPTDGAVVRTHLQVDTPTHLKVSIAVRYAHDDRLDVWVPSRMDERYDEESGEATTCSATYSHFRRFETAGRVVSPLPD
jgi:hypothetical protein